MKVSSAVRDRRTSPRHFLHVPLRVRLWKSALPEQKSVSQNLSVSGALFAVQLPVEIGSVLEVRLAMPEEITGEPMAEWRCSGHVVRVDPGGSTERQRVALQFDCYEVARTMDPQEVEAAI